MTATTTPSSGTARTRLPQSLSRVIAIALVCLLSVGTILGVRAIQAQEANSTPVNATPAANEAVPAGADSLTVTFDELNDSGISGDATLYDLGDRTMVVVDVEGAGGNHPLRINAGVCGETEPQASYRLAAVDDKGASKSIIDVSLDDLMASVNALVMHMAPDNLGTIIACANIQGDIVPGADVPATPDASPEVTPVATESAATTTPDASPSASPVATPSATEAATPTPAGSPADDGTGGALNSQTTSASANFDTLNDSGVTGSAVFTAVGDTTNVTIVLQGDAVTSETALHIHDGTCAAPGNETITLNPVNDEGVSSTLVEMPITSVLSGAWFMNVHVADMSWDTWAACVDLNAEHVSVITAAERASSTATATSAAQTTTQPTATAAAGNETASATSTATAAANAGDGTGGTAQTPVPTTAAATTSGSSTDQPVATEAASSGTTTQASATEAAGTGSTAAQPTATAAAASGSTTTQPTTTQPTATVTSASDAVVLYPASQYLPAEAGVGTALDWPESRNEMVILASGIASVILLGAAVIVRHGERHHDPSSRWMRLGL